MAIGAKKPEQVFTPRSAVVNQAMYIPRPDLEVALRRAMRGSLHVVLHGQSGTGKSWLYKKVFSDDDVEYEVLNLARAADLHSIRAGLDQLLADDGAVKTGYEEQLEGGVNAYFLSGKAAHTNQYRLPEDDAYGRMLACLRSKAKKRSAALVLDNLEAVTGSPELLDELANLITLLDDEQYSKHRVKLVIVGLPRGLKEY